MNALIFSKFFVTDDMNIIVINSDDTLISNYFY